MGEHDQFNLLSRSLNGRCYGNRFFLRESPKISIPHLHSVRWSSTTDGNIATRVRINIADDPSASDKHLVNFVLVTLSFAGAFASDEIVQGGQNVDEN